MALQHLWRFCSRCSSLFFGDTPDGGRCAAGGAHHAQGFDFNLPYDLPETANAQREWRFCQKCKSMFWNGAPQKGVCAAGGAHQAQGFVFALPHSLPEAANAQTAWRFCDKCRSMFWSGFPGRCPAGDTHRAQGWVFTLPHGAAIQEPEAPTLEDGHNQKNWRFCTKCTGMFFNGYPTKGRCPSGGEHEAAGHHFTLAHDIPAGERTQEQWRFCRKCMSLFFNGYPSKGACAGGGAHEAAGYDFVLPHGMAEAPSAQANWRYCGKCMAMFYAGRADRGRCPGGGVHQEAGFNFCLPHNIATGFVFDGQIRSGGMAALGGWMRATVQLDGKVRWQGEARNSGIDGYEFGVSMAVRLPSGRTLALTRSGHVGGSIAPGATRRAWDDIIPLPGYLAARLSEFAVASATSSTEYSSDIGDVATSVAGVLAKWSIGTALGPAGAVVFVGLAAGSLILDGTIGPGAKLAGGILWLAGPWNTLFAIAAEGLAAADSDERELREEEYRWANDKVFGGTLPPREKLVLTTLHGSGNRAFTFPRFDGKITLNMGHTGFADPRAYQGATGANYGRTFVHELVHACQLHYSGTDLTLLADALASKVDEAMDVDPYQYGAAGFDYKALNLEQQGQVVSDWFAGNSKFGGTNHTNRPMDEESPYFRYIVQNVRTHNY